DDEDGLVAEQWVRAPYEADDVGLDDPILDRDALVGRPAGEEPEPFASVGRRLPRERDPLEVAAVPAGHQAVFVESVRDEVRGQRRAGRPGPSALELVARQGRERGP